MYTLYNYVVLWQESLAAQFRWWFYLNGTLLIWEI